MKQLIFIYNNLKVDPFNLNDGVFPGFELLCWEHQTWIYGTLWNIGNDSGYSPMGKTKIYGQVWSTKYPEKIKDLSLFLGCDTINIPMHTECFVKVDGEIDTYSTKLNVLIYRLKEITKQYTIIKNGKWFINRD